MSNDSSQSLQHLELATKAELASITDMLSIAGQEISDDLVITNEQLSRESAEAAERKEIGVALTKNAALMVAATARLARESNRAMRDIKIATATHKELQLSIYKTMYQRKLKLEKKIKDAKYA